MAFLDLKKLIKKIKKIFQKKWKKKEKKIKNQKNYVLKAQLKYLANNNYIHIIITIL